MNDEEAREVLDILKQADGGCSTCVTVLFEAFKKSFPGYKKMAEVEYKRFQKRDD